MTARADLLIEIGTEELPPKALRGLMTAFADGVAQALAEQRLEYESIVPFASPRRLALTVTALADVQEDRAVEMKGPPVRIAFDDAGEPTPAAVAFAKKCGVAVELLDRAATDKGEWLVHMTVEKGHAAAEILPGQIETVLSRLPIPRPMR